MLNRAAKREIKAKAQELLEHLCTDQHFRYTYYQFDSAPLDAYEIKDIISQLYIIHLDYDRCFMPNVISELDTMLQQVPMPTQTDTLSMIAFAQNIETICNIFLEENAEWIRQECLNILNDKPKLYNK